MGVNWLSNDHLGPLSNGNAAPVGLQWTSAFNLDVPQVHLAKLRRLVSPSGCHLTSLALNRLHKTLREAFEVVHAIVRLAWDMFALTRAIGVSEVMVIYGKGLDQKA